MRLTGSIHENGRTGLTNCASFSQDVWLHALQSGFRALFQTISLTVDGCFTFLSSELNCIYQVREALSYIDSLNFVLIAILSDTTPYSEVTVQLDLVIFSMISSCNVKKLNYCA